MVKEMKKRWLLLALAASMVAPSVSAEAALPVNTSLRASTEQQSTTEYGVYKVLTRSNLRASASREGRWIATLPEGEYLIMKSEPEEFCQVEYNGTQGYIYRGCIKRVEGEELNQALEEMGLLHPLTNAELLLKGEVPGYMQQYIDEQVLLAQENLEAAQLVSEELAAQNEARLQEEVQSNPAIYPEASRNTLVATNARGPQATATNYEDAVVVVNAVLRQYPTAESAKLTTVIEDSNIQIIDEGENGYLHIMYGNQEGYVFGRTVSRGNSSSSDSGVLGSIVAQSTPVQASTSSRSNSASVVQNSNTSTLVTAANTHAQGNGVLVENVELAAPSQVATANTLENRDVEYQIRARANMREIPNQEGHRITTLPIGANVELLGQTAGGYTLVQYNGIQGYVLESVVVDSNDYAEIVAQQSTQTLYVLTGYCTCARCCGNYSPEVTGREARTATGTVPTAGRTIAVDPSVIPYGTVVHIDGMGDYIAEDCGGAVRGNHIDVYFDSHQEALNFGRQRRYVTFN